MRSRRLTAVVAGVTLFGLGAFASGAAARSKAPHLIGLKACHNVLVAADFRDELEEDSPPSLMAGVAETSTCAYGGLHADGPAGGSQVLTKGGIGFKCLANLLMTKGTAPPGGCWRFARATLVVARGRRVERFAAKLKKGVRATRWPAGFTRAVLHGVGDRAEYGFSGDHGWGYLQVLNAQLTVEVTEMGVIEVLKDAAAQL
ncbi:MAG: hypothetical protein ACYDA6_07825 [Solirubrobacteraceae bacterium]